MKEYAEILRAIADGLDVQLFLDGAWQATGHRQVLCEIAANRGPDRMRVSPRVVLVGSVEVPEPLRVAPDVGGEFWLAEVSGTSFAVSCHWDGDTVDKRWLARGLCHATKDAAIAHARALLSFTTTEEQK